VSESVIAQPRDCALTSLLQLAFSRRLVAHISGRRSDCSRLST